MKLQIESQHLRLRIDESELRQLLAGGELLDQTRLPGAPSQTRRLRLHEDAVALHWQAEQFILHLPRTALEAYVQSLPCREGLRFGIGDGDTAIALVFEVDVRDSVRQRGPRRR